jgi:DNA repair exonuclease SbcCD ATPase subunit
MLNSLKLTNFRKVTSDEMIFTPGINVIRGLNESSKSTRLESIAYALFGSRSLRTPIEQTVTWGEPVNTLKVELALTVGDKVYNFKRSKSGAEVTVNGTVFCTGQNEVSALAASLLGADATTASKLLLASQNGIRGALEEGPKALSMLIEDLADMAVFDTILEAAQTKLALGSPLLLEERLKGAESTLEAATQSLPTKPNEDEFRGHVAALNLHITTVERTIADLSERVFRTNKAWQDNSALYLKKTELSAAVDRAVTTLKEAEKQAQELSMKAARFVEPDVVMDTLKQQLSDAQNHAKRSEAYKVFKSLPEVPRYWNGSAENFVAASKSFDDTEKSIRRDIASIESAIRELNRQRLDGGPCSKCGQPTAHLTHIPETNAQIDAKLAEIEPALQPLKDNLEVAEARREYIAPIPKSSAQVQPLLHKLAGYVDLDEEFYPPKVSWMGSVPAEEAVDVVGLRKRIAAIEADWKAKEADEARAQLAKEQYHKLADVYAKVVAERDEFKAPDADMIIALTEAKDQAIVNLNVATGEIELARKEIAEITKANEQAKQMWAVCQSRVEDAQRVIAECKADLDSLSFNNGLVKKLRAIRPVIANKLWNTVLASVSVMFSQMRREESWVTKEKDGFKVNGQSVESLSGSTLDLLGLALRTSMLHTFLPQCGLLVLDEPMHGCDADRSESMLGFLKSVDFRQTLLVSHEEVSESVADNLIVL